VILWSVFYFSATSSDFSTVSADMLAEIAKIINVDMFNIVTSLLVLDEYIEAARASKKRVIIIIVCFFFSTVSADMLVVIATKINVNMFNIVADLMVLVECVEAARASKKRAIIIFVCFFNVMPSDN